MEKTFLLTGDLHAGSAYALVPPGFVLSNGSHAVLNSGQRFLQQIYETCLSLCPELDAIITMGDMVDGQNYKENARFLVEQDPMRQVSMAHQLLEPFAAKLKPQGRIWCLRGSKYHTGGDAFEEALGMTLNAEQDPFGNYTFPWLRLPVFKAVGGVLIDAAHHQSYASVNKVMPLEREIRDVYRRCGLEGRRSFDYLVILRAHTHFGFRVVQEEAVTAVSLPPMKLQDTFASGGKRPNNTVPDSLGMVIMTLYDQPPYIKLDPILGRHPDYTERVFV